MPARTMDTLVLHHRTATDVLATVEHLILPKREKEANVWLPHARKLRRREMEDPTYNGESQFWLTVWTIGGGKNNNANKTLEMVLTCTSNHLGNYPIFLYSHIPSSLLTPAYLGQRIPLLVEKLSEYVSSSRVFSVFGPTQLTRAFVSTWSSGAGAMPEDDPFYAAKLTYCTASTLTPPMTAMPSGDFVRPAETIDTESAAVLCKEFADDSVHFPLTLPRASREAQDMIRNRQLWVYYTTVNGRQELASIVACTRVSDNVAAITKVYTNPLCRRRGCAERLVRRVCEYWLQEVGKQSVVLYVAHDNKAAETVYHRVGFQGLNGRNAEGVEDWLEIGFMNTERGHW